MKIQLFGGGPEPCINVSTRFYPFSLLLRGSFVLYFAPEHQNTSIMIENEFLNRVELRGRVGHDPKVFSVGDAQVARFSLATNEAFRGKSGELRVCAIYVDFVGGMDSNDLRMLYLAGAILLGVGIAFLINYSKGKKMLAKEMEAEEKKLIAEANS